MLRVLTPPQAWSPRVVSFLSQSLVCQVEYLSISDDGTGIQDLSQALSMADSTKLQRRNDEIGQFGKGLKFATWHLGDDCFIMTM